MIQLRNTSSNISGRTSPRVLAIIGVITGCEFYRIMMPYKHLLDMGYKVAWVHAAQLSRVDLSQWDVLVLPRIGLENEDEADSFVSEVRKNKKAIVYEVDDDFYNLEEHNPSYHPDHIRKLDKFITVADQITTSTPYLASQLLKHNKFVAVLENCIDPDVWDPGKMLNDEQRMDIRRIEGLTFGIHGGNSHQYDWQILEDVIPAVLEKYPEPKFLCAGYFPEYFKKLPKDRVTFINWVPVRYYHIIPAQIDIGLCPLQDTIFNRSKSMIKAMEHGMNSAPVVASPTVYSGLIEHNHTGFIAQTKDDWIKYIGKLIENPKLRQKLGRNLRGKVMTKYNIHQNAWRWMNVYTQAWERVKTKA